MQEEAAAVAMFAADEFGFRRAGLQSQALRARRYCPLEVHFNFGAQAPDVAPPRIARAGSQRAPLLPFGSRPRRPRGAAQFAMCFRLVVVLTQLVERGIGKRQRLDALCGEEGRQMVLLELVQALDLASAARLAGWSVQRTKRKVQRTAGGFARTATGWREWPYG